MSERGQGKKATSYKNKYNAKAYDSLRIVVPKGRKSDVEEFAQATGQSINGLVNELLRKELSLTAEEWKQTPHSALFDE